MAKNSIQGFVELASGLGEMTKARAAEAADELLALTSLAPAAGKKVAKQATGLAEGLLQAAESNRQQLITLVRNEIDAAISKLELGSLTHEVANLSATLQVVLGQLEQLLPGHTSDEKPASAKVAPVKAAPVVKKAAAKKSAPAVKKSAPVKAAPVVKKSAPAKPVAKKSAPAKAAAKKSVPAVKKSAPAKAAPAVKKVAAKKSAPAPKASTTT